MYNYMTKCFHFYLIYVALLKPFWIKCLVDVLTDQWSTSLNSNQAFASLVGMKCRWCSYDVEQQQPAGRV